MKRINLSSVTHLWVTTLAVIGLTALAPVRNIQAFEADPVSAQTTEILALLSAVHELTSYNGNADTRAQHLAAWEQLWAVDSTFTINGGVPIVGRDAIMAFFWQRRLFQ